MKIAVVSPSPVPFTIGGAENLAWGLCDSINKYTDNQAELIKLPTKELSFWNLIDSYYQFYKLDLSHFDMVISTKYPSWMGLPQEVQGGCGKVDEFLAYMIRNQSVDNLDNFFGMLFAMRDCSEIPESYFTFPGPLIRKIVHFMDSFALRQKGMNKLCAISDTVRKRKNYFSTDSYVETIYPPTTIKAGKTGNFDYIFMISRLDGPKRIDMLINAMKYVKSYIRLLIAGTGSEKDRLEQLVEGDGRIEFLGFVLDEEVDKYYSNALVIPYFPYDEDYGYITIEAMLHSKPVITTDDAGGPNEFVIDLFRKYF